MSNNEKTKYKFNNDKENTLVLVGDKINGTMTEKQVDKDIFLIKSNVTAIDTIKRESNSNVDGLLLNFSLKGESSYKSHISNFNFQLKDNSTNISLITDEIGGLSMQKGELEAVCIIVKKEFLLNNLVTNKQKDTLLKSLDKKMYGHNISSKKTDFYTQLLLKDIVSSPFENKLNKLFIHSKVLDILYLELTHIFKNDIDSTKSLRIDEYDIEAIKKAKEILIQNLQNPPSILELARLVKINDFKLKVGFKKIFNTTPYNLLIDYKLRLAKKLLTNNDMNITEIAQFIGYKYTQNFTNAFVKKFGIKPRDIMKNSTYY